MNRARVAAGAIIDSIQELRFDYARPGRLSAQRRHHPAQPAATRCSGASGSATHAWQFPQGGIKRGETPEQAMFRELHEEVGLQPEHVRILGAHARLAALRGAGPVHPARCARPLPGQKQIWFLLQLVGPRLRHQAARHRPSRVRRLALERLLGAARVGDRVQARRLPAGADRTGALPAPGQDGRKPNR